MKDFFRELNKRKVTRVAIAYLVFSWVVLQIADIVLPAVGLTDELIHVLSRIPGLRVASRRSSFALRGQEDDLSTVAEKLNVTHVLEGSVRKDGGTVRISAQLTRADSDSILWSNTYDRELCDVLAIQGA